MLKIIKAHIVLLELNYPCPQHLRGTSNYEHLLSALFCCQANLSGYIYTSHTNLNLTINQILIQFANIKITDKRYLAKRICFEQEVNILD